MAHIEANKKKMKMAQTHVEKKWQQQGCRGRGWPRNSGDLEREGMV